MQKAAPDILITNYSMLEYMLLRPIERTIFEQTAQWLACSQENYLTVVLDEAHMYRGSGGAEVAYLLRRLHSRLRVGRDRIRYILTSASLGSTKEANQQIKLFIRSYRIRKSQRICSYLRYTGRKKSGERTASISETIALSAYDFTSLHKIYEVGVRQAEEAFVIFLESWARTSRISRWMRKVFNLSFTIGCNRMDQRPLLQTSSLRVLNHFQQLKNTPEGESSGDALLWKAFLP